MTLEKEWLYLALHKPVAYQRSDTSLLVGHQDIRLL
jgi:hypothetical protein